MVYQREPKKVPPKVPRKEPEMATKKDLQSVETLVLGWEPMLD